MLALRLRGTSRRALFDDLERAALKQLPAEPVEYAEWKQCRARFDNHAEVHKHYYSAPSTLLKEKLSACITARTVELFHNGSRVASHVRSSSNRQITTFRSTCRRAIGVMPTGQRRRQLRQRAR